MSRLRQIAKALTTTEEPFTNMNVPRFGTRTRTGVTVNTTRAMQHGAVWACVRNRAEDIAKLPIRVVEYDGTTRTPQQSPAWLEKPNTETTPFELIERTSASIDVDGTAFWWVGRDRLGRVGEVWVLPPQQTEVFRDPPKRGQTTINPKRYRYAGTTYEADEIVQINGFTLAGRLRGLNPIEQHAHSIGLSIAAEEYGSSFFGNGATPSGIVELPAEAGTPDRDQLTDMQDGIMRDHTGLANAHRPGVLWGGAKWVPLTISNEASQFLESRNYQLRDIARIYRQPPHKVGDLERATFSNIEHQSIEYVVDAIIPMVTRIEQAVLAAGLLGPAQHLKFNLAALLRGDTLSRYQAYAIGRQWGWLCADDIRELEDLGPLPDGSGQIYLNPMNMVPAALYAQPDPMLQTTGGSA